jgi:hypothetical protein
MLDLRVDSPTSSLVLPLPSNLTLISADRECGSELCDNIYVIGSPHETSSEDLTARLWAHLTGTKGWQRRGEDAACRRPGWFLRHEFCLFVRVERAEPAPTLRLDVTAALGAPLTALLQESTAAGTTSMARVRPTS